MFCSNYNILVCSHQRMKGGIAYCHFGMWICLNFHQHSNAEINTHTEKHTHTLKANAIKHRASFWQPKKLDVCAIEIRKLDFSL